jgi:acyl transferase domain-containing protein/NAD(P)H-dependent flavin oxidoreductase YrpB (nitropropane dioxygenase family)/NAD(P)-dependent dehydrogenase (short-subunit alcohol dehydrogenase family)
MSTTKKENPLIFVSNPFRLLDLNFAVSAQKAGACPLVCVSDWQTISNETFHSFSDTLNTPFGVVFTNLPTPVPELRLPTNLEYVIIPTADINITPFKSKKIIIQVTSLEQAHRAMEIGAYGVIAKGNEAGGLIGEDSTFILFQKLINTIPLPIWCQGGVGIHTSAALVALGATGVILDFQLSLFPEIKLRQDIKSMIKNMDGSETKVFHSHRVWVRPGSIKIDDTTSYNEFVDHYTRNDTEPVLIPAGQDIGQSAYYYSKYKKLKYFVFAIRESIAGHIKQAQYFEPLKSDNALAQELKLEFPIAQGPMTRVSDVPQFANAVAEAGALPFLALALLNERDTHSLLTETAELMNGKTWGAGVLGFISSEILSPQLKHIMDVKPPVVLIAGGRPSQAKPLEKVGIKVFLHVPSLGLLDSFLKEGAKRFVFEGRECGGHVGPLSSFVLWEKQINRLLQEEDLTTISVFFAGGIHDALSSSMVSVMTAPLVARGAKVGVLMGSSYLFTKEAVETGAILQQYQQEAILKKETTLLESSPGHVVRCLKTPFIHYFTATKEELLHTTSSSSKEIGNALEKLNVGRLRIATKGLERQQEKLVSVDETKQLNEGLYMVGQVITLRDSIVTLRELHNDVILRANDLLHTINVPDFTSTQSVSGDIAIIGMACIFPDAKNLDEYWKNILLAKDSVTEIPDDRWSKELYFDPQASTGVKSTSKWGGFIPAIEFDPIEFGIPPQSLAAIEPVQLLSLKVAKAALQDAGYAKKEFDRDNTSVIFGVENGSELAFGYELRGHFPRYFGDIPAELDAVLPKLTEDSFPGVLSNVVSGRIANRLDLGGKNYTVDAACGSSLAALDMACQELILDRASMVIAGAADLHNGITDYLKFSSAQALTSEGRCKSFDQHADGISLGEGIGVVVLKRLEDATHDGDKIYAVIKSVGASSDGKSLGLTAPNKKGQLKAFERAYQYAGVSPSELGLIEAHGTGTSVGDKTELSSMTELILQAGALPGQLQLGSVKTQIGHTKCAAGMAGLIKASLSVYHAVKPPTLNISKPNAYYNNTLSPFVFNDKASPWLSEKRIAGISAFGFGGTNFHAVLENFNALPPAESALKDWPSELFVFRAESDSELQQALCLVHDLLTVNDQCSLKNLSFSLAKRNQKPVKLSIVADTIQDLKDKVNAAIQHKTSQGIYPTKTIDGKIAFLFSGQGSQRVNMARDLLVAFPGMRKLLKGNLSLEKILFPPQSFDQELTEKQKETIKDTNNAQPLLGIVDYAIAELLISFGIQPDMLAGHSYGEVPALCLAGVIRENDLVELSKNRALSIMNAVDTDAGAMVAVSCNETALKDLLKGEEGISIANHNSPSQWVLAGDTESINKLCAKLKAFNQSFKRLEVACAFHSPLIAKSQKIFEAILDEYTFGVAQIPVWSNTSAEVYPSQPEEIKKRLSEHLVKPVKFHDEIQNMYDFGARIFIETGPGSVLTKLTERIIAKDQITLNTEQEGANGITKLVHLLAQFLACGRKINMEKLFEGRDATIIDLNNVSNYIPSKTTWTVNGRTAVPIHGKLPSYAGEPITKPLSLTNTSSASVQLHPKHEGDKVMLGYLENVQALIKAQHEAVMYYFGSTPDPDKNLKTIPLQQIRHGEREAVPTVVTIREVEGATSINSQSLIPSASIINVVLLETVSEKTGYPIEMLDMEMDIEADLSIDSIKRVEIINALTDKIHSLATLRQRNDGMIEELTAIKTLRALQHWLLTKLDDLKPADSKAYPETIISKIENSSAVSLTFEALTEILLEAICEKTGYPKEMLDMNMDMEADLSIDSIKRVEIIHAIQSKIDFRVSNPSDQDDLVEKLASIKTLQGLTEWILNSLTTQHKATPLQPEITTSSSTKLPVQDEIIRLGIDYIKSLTLKADASILSGKRIAITDDGGLVSKALKESMENLHAYADIVTEEDSLEGYDGLIALELFNAPKRTNIHSFFSFVQKLNYKQVSWIVAVTDIKRQLEDEPIAEGYINNLQGYSGFLNSLNKEWNATCRTINLEDLESLLNAAAIVVDEFCYDDDSTETFYRNGERFIGTLKKLPLNNTRTPMHLSKNSTVLVLGGAQGITAEILKKLAMEMPCTYILVGRSPEPKNSEDTISASSLDEIRKILVSKEKFESPSALERRVQQVYKRNQILQTTEALKKTGSTVHYYSLDLTDESALINLLKQLYHQYGKIDGVIHAAGYLDDKFFHKKTSESFKKVYSTKITPLKVLSNHLRSDTQFCVLFSSIASVMGNKGQVDYAAANSVLDQAAQVLRNKIKGRVVAINWGPWKGKGMISEALEKDLMKRGITSIPLEVGANAFVNELKFGEESQIILMTKVEELIEALAL